MRLRKIYVSVRKGTESIGVASERREMRESRIVFEIADEGKYRFKKQFNRALPTRHVS